MSVSLKIKIFENTGTRILQVSKSTLTIGSASHCDIVLDHPSVNPEHTRAWLEGGRIWIQDLGSPSGTALNDIRLPALKPMLVRDLDVLRLGESPSTLGLEAIVVRAPVVKPKAAEPTLKEAAIPESKGLSNVEIEKRREEAANLGRELAELRLHLQMASLEKVSADEMTQQLNDLREEAKRVQEQKTKWDESLRQVEADKITLRKNAERELAEYKSKALIDLKKVASAETQAQIKALSDEIAKLHEQRQGLTESLRQAEVEKSGLQIEMKKAALDDAKVQGLNNEIKKLVEQKQKLTETVRLAGLEITNLQAELKKTTADGSNAKGLNAELKAVTDEKAKLLERLRLSEAEKEATRKGKEKEVTDAKANAFKEMNTMLLAEAQKANAWKHEALTELTRITQKLSQAKVRSWATRPLSSDMIQEWEADVVENFRRVLLEDDSPYVPSPRAKVEAAPMAATSSRMTAASTSGSEIEHESREAKEARRARRKRQARATSRAWRSFAVSSLILGMVLAGIWFGTAYFRQHANRSLSSSSQMASAQPASAEHSLVGEHKPDHPQRRFEPKQGKKYRGTYTENVLYLENYVAAEENMDFRKRWNADLTKVAGQEWKIDRWSVAPIAIEEQTLIQDLDRIKATITPDREQEGVAKMHERENKFMQDLTGVFKTRAGVDRYLKFKRSFYQRNQAYLSRAN